MLQLLAAIFVNADKHGEDFILFEGEYGKRDLYFKSMLKIVDFAFAKDGYRF